jgi:lipid-binding SYLF domain-containing protein
VVIRNMTSSHQIRSSLLENAECIAMIPPAKQAAAIVGGKQWNLGAEAAAAGPIVTSAGVPEANGGKTPVLVYTTSTGAFAGASLEGSKISVNDQNIRNL